MSTHRGAIDCDQHCAVPDGHAMADVPIPRHAWGDVLVCPNGGCERAFLIIADAEPAEDMT